MFDFIRTHQRLMQVILLILVVPSFVFLGISGYSFVTSDTTLAEVGSASVTKDEFVEAQRNQLQQMQQNAQGHFDPAMLETPQARQALLDQLINRQIEINVATNNHLSVSDRVLRESIAAMPQMQEDGKFSPKVYDRVLASYGMSPRDFEASQRGSMALALVLDPVAETASLPGPVIALLQQALTETRTVRLRSFPAKDYLDAQHVSDDAVQAWYDAHQDDLRLPEQVSVDYLVLDEAAAIANVPGIDDTQLKEYYEQNKARFTTPARVNLRHILIKVAPDADEKVQQEAQAKAKEVAAKAQQTPGQFGALAEQYSDDAGSRKKGGALGWTDQDALPQSLSDVVFKLSAGEVSEPVKGPQGYHVFLADDVRKESSKPFDEVQDEIQEEVRQQLAADHFADMASNLTNLAYDNADSLAPAAEALGLKVRHATGVAQDRLLSEDEAGPDAASASDDAEILDDARVRQALFSTQVRKDKQNSGVIEIAPDTLAVVRVGDITPAHVPPLADVAKHIKQVLLQERALEAARKAGEEVLAALQKKGVAAQSEDNKSVTDEPAKDQSTDDRSVNGTAADNASDPASGFGEELTLTRLDSQGLRKAVLDTVFTVPHERLPAYAGVELPQAYTVIEVIKRTPGTTDDPALADLGAQLSRVWGDLEQTAVLSDLREELDVKITDDGKALIAEGDSAP